jgi:hypothetical protein
MTATLPSSRPAIRFSILFQGTIADGEKPESRLQRQVFDFM